MDDVTNFTLFFLKASLSQLTENTEYRYRVCAISVAGQGPFSSVFAEAAINDLELWHKLEKISEER